MGVLVRLVLSAIALAVCLWPIWLYLWMKSILVPVGFWQNIVMVMGGFFALAGLQVMFAILWFVLLWAIWIESHRR